MKGGIVIETILGALALIVSSLTFTLVTIALPLLIIYVIAWPIMLVSDSFKAVNNAFRRK